MKNIKVIDCTFRDGGYYGNWNFKENLIQNYLTNIKLSKVDILEIGFRFWSNSGFKGPTAYTTDDFLSQFKGISRLKISVMINASDFILKSKFLEKRAKSLFKKKKFSPVSLVRIACHSNEIKPIIPLINLLKSYGYQVGVNIMQISEIKNEEIIQLIQIISNNSSADILYFADSLGALDENKTSDLCIIFRKYWKKKLGIHAHDNLGKALSNTIVAASHGFTYLDSTILGMGRGAGNTKTEELLFELNDLHKKNYDISKIAHLLDEFFIPLQKKYGWGKNYFYYLAGKYKIHPTYIQQMLGDPGFQSKKIFNVIELLKNIDSRKYDLNNLKFISNVKKYSSNNFNLKELNPKKLFFKKNILLISSGSNLKSHSLAIENFVKKNNLIVIALNTTTILKDNLIKYRVICNPVRVLADLKILKISKQKIIAPINNFPEEILKSLNLNNFYNFGVTFKNNKYSFNKKKLIIPANFVFPYILGILHLGGASKIYLSGFDGYLNDDFRNEMNNNFIQLFQKSSNVEIVSITKSKYKVSSISPYAQITIN